ncbi:hypothetical protein VZC37_20315 [Gordonia sp. LSe1-13]|uniref:Lipoprotein n=1 Tax=Gordonia sesuvii TaxID=3116777 RepID=A0ABU7MI23_9ACTN|nr:hypothetical protein [Gordonia sp. LSe1-13]
MKRTAIALLIGAGCAGAGLVAGAGHANAEVEDGTYNLCIQTRYGSSVEERCGEYRVEGDSLIGSAGTPLTLVDTPTGGYADIEPVSRITLIKTDDGYKAINSVLGIPVATSTFNPVEN